MFVFIILVIVYIFSIAEQIKGDFTTFIFPYCACLYCVNVYDLKVFIKKIAMILAINSLCKHHFQFDLNQKHFWQINATIVQGWFRSHQWLTKSFGSSKLLSKLNIYISAFFIAIKISGQS